ncbi:uncharacterized protein B0H18DRAFT_1121120 [Fomitopsis serialis]|uniref:uncharacterized protein n=1 Tax=Fomitopsis serialis TaxID=139415 RepID=UPI002008D684|nr:uncharacterized protein B0H18DRAFT_1121120 [Neoantrodia serialis]KAH9922103.1 hypothetical protein B0H18DRAFT_1121120 [Neoantrodia serialis]
MAELLRAISEEAPLAGCIVLTAALSDRTFAQLEEADFASVYESKMGVVDTLRECVDVGALEFLVPFSSGFRGGPLWEWRADELLRYVVRANTPVEEQVSACPNTFAFVCPGIIDSTMMRSSELGESGKVAQLEQFAQWGVTAEDALARFQTGERFTRYVPTVDWYALERTRCMPLLGRHLLSTSVDAGLGSSATGPGASGVGAADEGRRRGHADGGNRTRGAGRRCGGLLAGDAVHSAWR